ncbi:XRE family transcriptional regulator [Pseudomonas aeruginosa]|nr:XRE family transcriptional regulator [Pseudomonas aeruginosa]
MTVDRIGERLRRYRRAAKKTLHQVASESGLTASFLSQAERNLTGVSIPSLANIAKSLNIPLNALFDQPIEGRQYPLGAGDSVHFDATKTHCLANVGSDVAEVLTITTMGLFDDHPTP